jgi:cell division protein FtsB
MDATVTVAIVTTIGTVIVAIITFFQNKSLKKENKNLSDTKQKLETEIKEIKLISTGMVVAYFFSFIRPLFDKISESELTIVEGDKKYNIDSENIKLELIIPKQLDKTSFENATSFYKSVSGIGAIVNKDGKVLYKEISYRIAREINEAVILIDVPAILKSALKYYKVPLFDSQKNLKDILEREINNFKSEITRMIENDELDGKVLIREY